jgi:hypothetical protein
VNFDPYNGNVTRTNNSGTTDIFLARYRPTKKVKKDNDREDMFTANEDRRITSLYPNPADDLLRIDWHGFDADEPIEVRILDLFGRPVMTRSLSTEEDSMDVTSLVQGHHIFQARQNNVTQIQRFIKK